MMDPMSALVLRDAVWPGDRKAAVSFIDGLQRYEHGVEPNRRIDASVGAEYCDVLLAAVAEHDGIVRIAELDGGAIGWVVAWHDLDDMYVVAEERRFVYISELYVEEEARGTGIRARTDRVLRGLGARPGHPHRQDRRARRQHARRRGLRTCRLCALRNASAEIPALGPLRPD